MRAPQHSRRVVVGVLVATLVVLAACQPVPLPPPEDGSTLIGCDAAGVRAELTTSSHLDPTCTYTAGFDITASDVTLDCQGATIAAPISANGAGILIHTPVEVAMDHVTVRNCRVEGFLNSIKVTRDGFRTLPDDGQEFAHPTTDIVIERTVVTGSRGVGIYVDGYVSGVTLRRNEIKGAGGSGIYLETGSKQSIVEGNQIVDNGYIENGPNGTKYKFSGIDFWFWGIGREGISVDGSYENTIRGNVFTRNSAGGIFMYKNCGEYPDRPRYFERRDPADHNLIQGNVFVGGREGIWVSSRMGENTLPMECTDEAYIDEPLRRVVRDHASHNVILGNQFVDVTYGVRVEDDDERRDRQLLHRLLARPPRRHRGHAAAHRGPGGTGDPHQGRRQHLDHRREPQPLPVGARRDRVHRARQHRPRPDRGVVRGPDHPPADLRDGDRRAAGPGRRQQAPHARPHRRHGRGAAALRRLTALSPGCRASPRCARGASG